MEVLIKYEVNGNSILKEYKNFLDFEDFQDKFIKNKLKIGYRVIAFLNGCYEILQKENNCIRCFF